MLRVFLLRTGLLQAFCLTGLLYDVRQAHGENWPGWRGPTGLGFSSEKNFPLNWGGANHHNVLWKVGLPGIAPNVRRDGNQSSPIVWKNRVFVASSFWHPGVAAESVFPEHHLTCFAANDGRQLWDAEVPHGPWLLKDLRGGYSAPTPATDGDHVYVLFGSSVLAAVTMDGRVAWSKDIVPYRFDVAIGTSPIIYEDTIIVICSMANPKDSGVKAFDKKAGALKWEISRPRMRFAHSTPVIVSISGKSELIVTASGAVQTEDGIASFDPGNGQVIWWCAGSGDVPTPAFGSGLIFAVDGRGGNGTVVDPTGRGNVTRTHLKWTSPRIPDGTFSSPIIVGGLLYQLQNPGLLKCWKVTSGEKVYEERLPGISTTASPVTTPEGLIYYASAGKSCVIESGPRFRILAVNDLSDDGPASAAFSNGRIFLKGGIYLYCIGAK